MGTQRSVIGSSDPTRACAPLRLLAGGRLRRGVGGTCTGELHAARRAEALDRAEHDALLACLLGVVLDVDHPDILDFIDSKMLEEKKAWALIDAGYDGSFTGVARVGDAVREGVANAPSVWWTKLAPDGRNANDTTSQRETDLGHGPVFYDNLVEISPAD